MKFIHSHYKNKKVSIVLSQIVAVGYGDEGRTHICCTDNKEYRLSEPYDLIMQKIEECLSGKKLETR